MLQRSPAPHRTGRPVRLTHPRISMLLQVKRLHWIAAVAACTVAVPAMAQQRVVTAADYARAERSMNNLAVTQLAAEGQVSPNWLPGDRFWYRDASGEFILVDPARK